MVKLFATAEERAARKDEREAPHVARGVKVVVADADQVPKIVEEHCDRGWVLDFIAYAGPGFVVGGTKAHALQTVVFRWPADAAE
jgi:hypothetical protein